MRHPSNKLGPPMKTLFRSFGFRTLLPLILSLATPFALKAQTEPVMGGAITNISVYTGSGSVINIKVLNGGAGYDPANPPTVTWIGGSGTTSAVPAIATVSEAGVVTSIAIVDGGTGY